MIKNPTTRLDETIAFIKKVPLLPETVLFPPTQKAFLKALPYEIVALPFYKRTLISTRMSQMGTDHENADSTDKKYRRAAVLLESVFSKPGTGSANRRAVNDDGGPAKDIYTAAFKAAIDAYYSRFEVAATQFSLLKESPKEFLQTFFLQIANAKVDTDGMARYKMFMKQGTLKLFPTAMAMDYPDAFSFKAINVPAQTFKDLEDNKQVGAIKGSSSTDAPGCTLMLTTQFSGCTFCFNNDGNQLTAAHLDPRKHLTSSNVPHIDAVTMGKRLQQEGAFAGGATVKTFSRSADGGGVTHGYAQTGKACVLAVKKENRWKVYAQKQANLYLAEVIRMK